MFVLGLICCRGGSKGVPGKNIRLLKGKPLITYTIETAKNCKKLNDVIVSTDDETIFQTAKQLGCNIPFVRPKNLATDGASKWPVFIHAVEMYESQTGVKVDYIADLDVTVPLKTAEDIDGAITMAVEQNAEVVITGYIPEKNPFFNMMIVGENGIAKVVASSPIPIVRRQDAPVVYGLSGAAFVVKKTALYKYEHWCKAPCKIYPIPKEHALDIDTETDFKFIEFLAENK